MDTRLLLVRICSLLYLERSKGPETSSELIKAAIGHIKPSDRVVALEVGKDSSALLVELVQSLLAEDAHIPIERSEFLQRARVCCTNDSYLYDALEDFVNTDYTPAEYDRLTRTIKREISHFNTIQKVRRISKQFSAKVFDADGVKQVQEACMGLKEELENLNFHTDRDKNPSIIESISLKKGNHLGDVMSRGKEAVSLEGVLRFGWQGFNRMFGQNRGARRGEIIVIGALEHQGKSTVSLELFKSVALYNRPHLLDPNKKPLLIRITAENDALQDMLYLYKSLKENEYGVAVDQREIDPEEAGEYVMDRLTSMGYHLEVIKIDPTTFTYMALFDLVKSYEADGFEIHLINFDYLNLISKDGCTAGAQGENIRDLFRRVKNFMESKNITFITPHQLSSEAAGLLRLGVEDFVKQLPGKKYWDSCKNIGQEVDMEVYIHIVVENGVSYMTFQRGKHRKFTVTPEADRYFVRRFDQIGGLRDDVNGPDLTRKRVGAAPLSEGGTLAFHHDL